MFQNYVCVNVKKSLMFKNIWTAISKSNGPGCCTSLTESFNRGPIPTLYGKSSRSGGIPARGEAESRNIGPKGVVL